MQDDIECHIRDVDAKVTDAMEKLGRECLYRVVVPSGCRFRRTPTAEDALIAPAGAPATSQPDEH